MEFLSQSFDKVHKMKEGEAVRHVKAQVEKERCFLLLSAAGDPLCPVCL